MEHTERFPNYLLVWVVLLILTSSSIVASVLVTEYAEAMKSLLLVFLFLIAAIKALLVAANFMNLRFESKIIWVLGLTAVIFVGFFIAGTVMDITNTIKR